jgi:hypothetical protein
MLQYMGSRQPPRKYIVPEVNQPKPPLKDACSICSTRVWTPRLFHSLRGAPLEQDCISSTYNLTSQELRKSATEGCSFCRTIADGVHGKVFLDELYARFEKTESWPGSADSKDEATESEDGTGSDEPNPKEDDWKGASAFNEEDIAGDVTGGLDAWDNRDTLIEPCDFMIVLSFERGEESLFTFMNARIEALPKESDDASCLHTLCGEQAVELRYHVNEECVLNNI